MAEEISNESNDVGQLIRETETAFISGGGTLTAVDQKPEIDMMVGE